jgi:hypothetical protein
VGFCHIPFVDFLRRNVFLAEAIQDLGFCKRQVSFHDRDGISTHGCCRHCMDGTLR